jgi:hypothetical protein
MREYMTILNEIYQEPKDSSFTHEGAQYDLNAILKATKDNETVDVEIADLIWVFKYDPMTEEDADRIFGSDLEAPILITVETEDDQEKVVVLDGEHRLAKAVLSGRATLPAVKVDREFLSKFKI